ncbi:MAG: HAD family phosphatase [Pseudomonadota bacterium]
MASSDPPPFTTIIFDLGKVIVDFDHYSICQRLAQHCASPPDILYEKIFASGMEKQLDRGRITPEIFFQTLKADLDLQLDMAQFRDIWNTIFSLMPGMELLIQRLKNYTLICLSNTNQWHFEYCLQHFPVLRNFHAWILSYELGARKPEKVIFQKALEKAQALPSECLYIDDVPEFIASAEEMGIRGIAFVSAEHLERQLKERGVLSL